LFLIVKYSPSLLLLLLIERLPVSNAVLILLIVINQI